MRNLYNILRMFQWGFIGSFIGKTIYQYYDYKAHPAFYAMQSAPWYLNIEIYGIVTIVIVTVTLIIRRLIKRKL